METFSRCSIQDFSPILRAISRTIDLAGHIPFCTTPSDWFKYIVSYRIYFSPSFWKLSTSIKSRMQTAEIDVNLQKLKSKFLKLGKLGYRGRYQKDPYTSKKNVYILSFGLFGSKILFQIQILPFLHKMS